MERTLLSMKRWNVEVDGVSVSFLQSYLRCRMETHLSYIDRLTPIETATALQFGRVAHTVLEECHPAPAKHTYEAIREVTNRFETEPSTPEQQLLLGTVDTLLFQYMRYWKGDQTGRCTDNHMTVAPFSAQGVELEFDVMSPTIDDPGEYLAPMRLKGKIDACFRDSKGRLWLKENKFSGQIVEATVQDRLTYGDFQSYFYAYAWELQTGEEVYGTLYDITRKPALRQKKTEGTDMFLKRITDDLQKPERQDFYFNRWEAPIKQANLKKWLSQVLYPILTEVRMWSHGMIPTYVNPMAHVPTYGRSKFFDGIYRNDWTGYKVREPYKGKTS